MMGAEKRGESKRERYKNHQKIQNTDFATNKKKDKNTDEEKGKKIKYRKVNYSRETTEGPTKEYSDDSTPLEDEANDEEEEKND